MRIYQTKAGKLTGTDFHQVYKKAFGLYEQIRRRTKRRAYLRSAYFKKDKIFLVLFWQHLWDKHKWQDRMRRLMERKFANDLPHFRSFLSTMVVGEEGFEPSKWWLQRPLPYRLATPQYVVSTKLLYNIALIFSRFPLLQCY